MMVRIVCMCGRSLRFDTDRARAQLKHDRRYAYGDRVTDPRAFPMRLASIANWRYVGGDIGRSIIGMVCPPCASKEPDDPEGVS